MRDEKVLAAAIDNMNDGLTKAEVCADFLLRLAGDMDPHDQNEILYLALRMREHVAEINKAHEIAEGVMLERRRGAGLVAVEGGAP